MLCILENGQAHTYVRSLFIYSARLQWMWLLRAAFAVFQMLAGQMQKMSPLPCSLTYDSSHIIPDGKLVSFCFLPSKVVAEVEGQPEEEWVIHQLQAGIGQRILEQRAGQKAVSTWEKQKAFLLLPIQLCTQQKLSGRSASAFHIRRQHHESLMLNIKGNPGTQKSLSRRLFSFH